MKNILSVKYPSIARIGPGLSGTSAGPLAEEQEFLVALLLFVDFRSGAYFLNLRASLARNVLIAGLDDHIALFAQRFEVSAQGRLHPCAVKLFHDFISHFVERLLSFVVVLQHLQNQVALLGLQDVGELVPLHRKNFVFEFLGQFAALVRAQVAALILGGAVRVALGNFAEVFSVLHALQSRFRFFLERRQFVGALPLRVDLDFAQRYLLRAHKFCFARFIIFLNFVIGDVDVRPDFLANHFLREQMVFDVALEILPVHAFRSDGFFQRVNAIELVLRANLVELLDDVGFHADAHVLGALDEERLVNQVAKGVFLAVFNRRLQLFGSATALALLLGIVGSALARFLILAKGDDFIVDARDDLLDGLSGIRISGLGRRHALQFRSRRSCRLCLRGGRRSSGWRGLQAWLRLFLSCWRRRRLRTGLLRLRVNAHTHKQRSGAKRQDDRRFSHVFP